MKNNFRQKKQSESTAEVFSKVDLVSSRYECNVLHVHLMFYANLDSDVFASHSEKKTPQTSNNLELKGTYGCVELCLQ